jgi:hypothetical protein
MFARVFSEGNQDHRRRQQAKKKSQSFLWLAFPQRRSSILCGSVQVCHSCSVIVVPPPAPA